MWRSAVPTTIRGYWISIVYTRSAIVTEAMGLGVRKSQNYKQGKVRSDRMLKVRK